MKPLYWHPAGLKIYYEGGILYIEDLNPEQRIRFLLSRTELLFLGFKCIWRAMVR